MTLVAGWKCRDGFVIAADTEITVSSIIVQGQKIADYSGEGSEFYSVIVGGAGDVNFVRMAAQHIRDAVASVPKPTLPAIRTEVEKEVHHIHDHNIYRFWEPSDPDCPACDLVLAIEDCNHEVGILLAQRGSVSEIDTCAMTGSGSELAAHLIEKVWVPGLSAAVTAHLALSIFREVKNKAIHVGGNTEVIARRSRKDAEPFFNVDEKDYRFLWGLEDFVLSGIRNALDRDKPEASLEDRIGLITNRLRGLRVQARKEREDKADQVHITEFGTEYGNWFKDY
jgi:hypothetical protein